MKYEDLKIDFNLFEEIYNDVGKIPDSMLKKCNYPSDVNELIKKDYKYVFTLINFYYNHIKNKLDTNVPLQDIKTELQIIKNQSNNKKKIFIQFSEVIIKWLLSIDFFNDMCETHDAKKVDINDILSYKNKIAQNTIINKFEPRINQKDALERLTKNGLETGIHCQATGCGKTFIILYYIEYCRINNKTPKIILFTERISILADLFQLKKKTNNAKLDDNEDVLEKDDTNIEKWKKMGICDLTNFNVINRVTIKKNDWAKLLIESITPTILIINRAYLTTPSKYKKFKPNDLTLILHDECHNTSSDKCHDFLTYCKSIKVPIVGFSATPLRTGKNDKTQLLKIYDVPNDNTKLNLLTDYNMIYAISNKLILPPEFYWYKIEFYNKLKPEDKNKELVTQEELGSVFELLNHIVPKLYNKKIIAWCGTIVLAKRWKSLFEQNYKQRKNMINFEFGIDHSQEVKNNGYEIFKKSKGNMILFCANKHREGSDIQFLDACIFLDKVKERSSIPFIQSIGRVLRICPDTLEKKCGIIIDGFVKDNQNYEKEFIHKIIGYYLALQNLTCINDDEISKYETYIKLLDIVHFDKENNIIDLKLGNNVIKINCNKLQWDDITKEFETVLQHNIKITQDDAKKIDFLKLKQTVSKLNLTFVKYKRYAKIYNVSISPNEEFKNHGWINYYDFLAIDISQYPINKKTFTDLCKKYNITNEKDYYKNYNKYNLPSMPEELYGKLLFNTSDYITY